MDCRTWRLAAVGLMLGSWGCSHSSGLQLGSNTPASAPVAVQQIPPGAKLEPEGPPRQPKAATCVAFAVLREQTAVSKQSTAERTELYDQARRAYQQALKVDPQYLPAHKGLARLYETLQDHERAVETYRRAVQLSPRDAETWYLMGMCHARRKEWQPALEALRKAVELDPENRRYLNDFGFCLARAERYQDAFNVMKKTGGEGQAHYNLARMLDHLGMSEPSKEHLRLALHHKADLEPARQLLYRLENPSAAEASGTAAPPTEGVIPVGHQTPAESRR